MQLSLGNMTMELNIFNIPKSAQEDDEVVEVDIIEASIDDLLISNHCDNPLIPCTIDSDFSVDVDSGIEEVNDLLDSTLIIDLIKWKEKIEPLPPKEKSEPFKLELLPKNVQHRSHSDMKKVVRSKVLKLLDFYTTSYNSQESLEQKRSKQCDIEEFYYHHPFMDKMIQCLINYALWYFLYNCFDFHQILIDHG